MNVKESIGSLIMTGFRGATLDDPQCRADVQLLKDLHIKGVILFDTHLPTGGMQNIVNEDQVRQLTDDLRHELGDDLLIGIDQEGGQVNRLGLFQDAGVCEQLSAKMQGVLSQRQLKATIESVATVLHDSRINLNFAPCIDLTINPDNPIIAAKDRSMGIDPHRVADAAMTIVSTYHNYGIRCCLKHFPGHGSSTTDTHHGIADITDTYADDEQLVYQMLIDSINAKNTPPCAIMTGHLINRIVDPDMPASLSHIHTTKLLREQLGFDGFIITDSIDMGAIRHSWDAGKASVLAIQAGADMVLDGFNAASDIPIDHPAQSMHHALYSAAQNGTITESQIAESISRRLDLISKTSR